MFKQIPTPITVNSKEDSNESGYGEDEEESEDEIDSEGDIV